MVLKLKKSTPNVMVYGETGRFPIQIIVKKRMINYWRRLVTGKEEKLSYILYKLCKNEMITYNRSTKWINNLNSILRDCGVGDLSTVDEYNANYISRSVETTLKDQFIQLWHHTRIENSSKCNTLYRHVKSEFKQENYLIKLPENLRVAVCKFRTSNHRLPIEEGRYNMFKLELLYVIWCFIHFCKMSKAK